jgi:hypothetical protein
MKIIYSKHEKDKSNDILIDIHRAFFLLNRYKRHKSIHINYTVNTISRTAKIHQLVQVQK